MKRFLIHARSNRSWCSYLCTPVRATRFAPCEFIDILNNLITAITKHTNHVYYGYYMDEKEEVESFGDFDPR